MDRLRLLLRTQATDAVEKIVRETLPEGMVFEWTDLVYQEKQAGNSALAIFALAVLLAFLIWRRGTTVGRFALRRLLIAPMSLLSAIVGVWVSGGDNNIFTQIGFVVLVGTAARTPIRLSVAAPKVRRRRPMTCAVEASACVCVLS